MYLSILHPYNFGLCLGIPAFMYFWIPLECNIILYPKIQPEIPKKGKSTLDTGDSVSLHYNYPFDTTIGYYYTV